MRVHKELEKLIEEILSAPVDFGLVLAQRGLRLVASELDKTNSHVAKLERRIENLEQQ